MSKLDDLASKREQILLAEIGAVLHDIGKLSPGFIVGVLADNDRREKYPAGDHPKTLHNKQQMDKVLRNDADVVPQEIYQPLIHILSNPVQAAATLLGSISLSDFITQHHEPLAQLPHLLKLVTIADRQDSGEDQYTADGDPRAKQRGAVYGATVFGHEAEPIDTSCLDEARREVWQALTDALRDNRDWGTRRDEFMAILAEKLSLTRGKTQRAANDITLYQHSRAVATRFKAYLARDLVNTTGQGQEESREFRLLNVAWDAWRFSVHVPRLSDAAGRRDVIEEFKERVRCLVELEYPLGNVVYHDDSTLVALVANLEVEKELQARIEQLAQEVTDGEIVPVVQLSPPTTQVTDIVGRRRDARQSQPHVKIPPWTAEWTDTQGSTICPVCGHRPLARNDEPHCDWCGQVRGRGARIRVGEEHRTDTPRLLPILVGGARRHLEKDRGTVWTGEISDRNGRLALLVGRLSLDRWLDGELLHTVLITSSIGRAQARGWGDCPRCSVVEALTACVQDPVTLSGLVALDTDKEKVLRTQFEKTREHLKTLETRLGDSEIHPDARSHFVQERKEKETELQETKRDLAELRCPMLLQDIFTRYPETDSYLREVASTFSWPLIEGYAVALARKNPSAARLFRTWETTEDFLVRAVPEAVQNLFDDDRAKPQPEQQYRHLWGQAQRIRFPLSDVPRGLKVGIYTVAVVNRDGQRYEIEVFLSREQGQPPAMITINRLSGEDVAWLEGCVDAGYIEVLARETGRKELRGDVLGIQAAIEEDYSPYHVLTTSPEMLVAILPAEIAPRVAQYIQTLYERELGKVIGRLPLYLDLFFMDEHFPMFVALDAARRAVELSDQLGNQTETWHVRQTPTIVTNMAEDQVYRLLVQPESNPTRQRYPAYALDVPFQLGNGEPDFYHPYFIVSQAAPGFPLEERSTHLRTPAGYIVHVSELQAGDQLCIYPNRFDFLFLDTAARRFDIRLDRETKRRPHSLYDPRHSPRPYLLKDLNRMMQVWRWCWSEGNGMTTTKLYGIRDLLVARFEEWSLAEKDRTVNEWQTYEELITQVLGKEFSVYMPGSQEYEGLRQAMLDGLFFDCLELHLQILKEKGV